MSAPHDKSSALLIIRDLARQFHLTAEEIVRALPMDDLPDPPPHSAGIMGRLLSYVGGIFVFAGVAAFIAIQWDDLNSAARVVVTLGSGIAAFILAVIALKDSRFMVAATPLFLTAAVLEPMGMMVAFNEFGSGGDWRVATMITSATVAFQFGGALWRFRRTELALVTIILGSVFWLTALDKAGLDEELIALTIGAAMVLLGIQVHRSAHSAISPPVMLFGSWALLWGVFEILENSPVEVLFLAAACGVTYLGIVIKSRTLNFTATVSILAYVGYFTAENFADSMGWPLALIGFGLALIGISALAVRIDRRYLRQGPGPKPGP